MKVVDTTILTDYLDGHDAVRKYLEAHPDVYITPAPVFTEILRGEVYNPDPSTVDLPGARSALDFVDVLPVDEQLAVAAAEFAGQVYPPGPKVAAVGAIVGALARRSSLTTQTSHTPGHRTSSTPTRTEIDVSPQSNDINETVPFDGVAEATSRRFR
jgi:predicted nucleic acid-binding protein